jgi:hypothetical protein
MVGTQPGLRAATRADTPTQSRQTFKMENNQQNAAKAKSAIPSCPKCDLNKAQFQKTMTNYSKAYRKKVTFMNIALGGPLIMLIDRWRG